MKWLRIILILLAFVILVVPVRSVKAGTADVSVTATGLIVAAAEGFTIYYISDAEVGISWTMPEGADQIMIRAKYGSYPEAPTPGAQPTDGYLVYYGSGESASDTAVSLDETATGVYYRAFTQTAGGAWSPVYSQGWIQGGGMTLIALFLLCIGGTYIGMRSSYYILKLLAGFLWVFMMAVWVNQPPTGFTAGDATHTIALIIFLGFALALWFAPIWTTRTVNGREEGAFNIRLPRILGGKTEVEEETERRLKSTTWRDRSDAYRKRLSGSIRGK